MQPYWVRVREDLGSEPLAHLAAKVVVSDIAVSGTAAGPGLWMSEWRPAVSLDPVLWLRRPVCLGDRLPVDMTALKAS